MAEHSLCVVVARLRCSPAVSMEDHRGAELLHSTVEVCLCMWSCVCAGELINVCLTKCFPLTLNHT